MDGEPPPRRCHQLEELLNKTGFTHLQFDAGGNLKRFSRDFLHRLHAFEAKFVRNF